DHLGRSVRECVPALADSVEAIVRSIVETGEPVTGIEVAGQRAAQVESRYWVTYWHPLRRPDGEIVAVNVAAEEITERKRAEGRLRVQNTVAQILAEAATIEEATPRILRAIGECLGWDVGALWRVDREAEALRCVELWHKASIEVPEFERVSREFTLVRGLGLPGRVWSSLEPEYIPDVVPDENFPRAPSARREGIHAAFGFHPPAGSAGTQSHPTSRGYPGRSRRSPASGRRAPRSARHSRRTRPAHAAGPSSPGIRRRSAARSLRRRRH